MIELRFQIVLRLEILMKFVAEKIFIALGYNSSEIKKSHIKSILRMANLQSENLRVVDAGANQGEFTDILLSENSTSEVLCIEPQASLVKILEGKYFGKKIKCLAVAVGSSTGTSKFFSRKDGDRKASLSNQKEGLFESEVQVQTLSEILAQEFPEGVDLIKLDLEGYDSLVLKKYFSDSPKILPKVIILEVSYLSLASGFTPSKTYRLLEDNGYLVIYRTSPVMGLVPVLPESLHDYEGHTVNWVAFRK